MSHETKYRDIRGNTISVKKEDEGLYYRNVSERFSRWRGPFESDGPLFRHASTVVSGRNHLDAKWRPE